METNRIPHVAFAVTLYDHHSVALVTLSDPRGDGRPRRMLAGFRVPLGRDDLVGLAPVPLSLKISKALTEALSAQAGTVDRRRRPESPGGLQGRPVVLRGQQMLTFD